MIFIRRIKNDHHKYFTLLLFFMGLSCIYLETKLLYISVFISLVFFSSQICCVLSVFFFFLRFCLFLLRGYIVLLYSVLPLLLNDIHNKKVNNGE